jgi:dTMP kinase
MGGALIVLEGVEGAGKTTQVGRLVARLESAGVPATAVREPGGTAAGDAIRRLLLDPDSHLDAATEALLFMASRAQLMSEVIRPELAHGVFVIADRFFLSTYAYQIAGRGLPEAAVREANRLATGGVAPDLNVLLDLPAGEGLARAALRGGADRMERSGADFHDRVRRAFLEFSDPSWQAAHPEAGPVELVNASADIDVVATRVAAVVARHWPRTAGTLAGSNS